MCAPFYDAHTDIHDLMSRTIHWAQILKIIFSKSLSDFQCQVNAVNSVPSSVTLAGWSRCPVKVRKTLPQQFSFPGSAHQTRVSGLEVQNHILGAETDAECGL